MNISLNEFEMDIMIEALRSRFCKLNEWIEKREKDGNCTDAEMAEWKIQRERITRLSEKLSNIDLEDMMKAREEANIPTKKYSWKDLGVEINDVTEQVANPSLMDLVEAQDL